MQKRCIPQTVGLPRPCFPHQRSESLCHLICWSLANEPLSMCPYLRLAHEFALPLPLQPSSPVQEEFLMSPSFNLLSEEFECYRPILPFPLSANLCQAITDIIMQSQGVLQNLPSSGTQARRIIYKCQHSSVCCTPLHILHIVVRISFYHTTNPSSQYSFLLHTEGLTLII